MRVPLVVVAAHPDDETIGAGALLLRARMAAVVHLTDGAPRDSRLWPPGQTDRTAYARLRREEALAALAEAGLGPNSVFPLGADDQEVVDAIAPLTRQLAAILDALLPRVVVTHAFEGGHPDHDAAAIVVRAAAALAAQTGTRLVEMTSYHRRGDGLEIGRFLPGPGAERVHRLSEAAREAKRRMLACYASQRDVLAPFGVEEERFRDAGALWLGDRPHPAPLHYETLGWTTFEAFRARAAEGLRALGLVGERPRSGLS